jgi:hypothetical protein
MKTLIVASCVGLSIASIGAQTFSPDDIATVIAQGRAGKTLQKQCSAYRDNEFNCVAEGPMSRIMRAAGDAKRQQGEFSATDVTPDLLRPVLTVVVRRGLRPEDSSWVGISPDRDRNLTQVGSALDAPQIHRAFGVAFLLKSQAQPTQVPINLKPVEPVVYSREKPGAFVTAAFDLAAFRGLPAGDVEIVAFITDAGTQRCTISDKGRRAIR